MNRPTKNLKTRVAVVYGGQSSEHEISLQSAASVLANLDRERFEVVPISIDKQGRWRLNDLALLEANKGKELPIFKSSPEVMMVPAGGQLAWVGSGPVGPGSGVELGLIDVVFPVMHGTLCEDGAIQGLLELAGLPYVGAAVLAAAVGMDKEISKRLAVGAGIPVVPWITVRKRSWKTQVNTVAARIDAEFGWPVFVKPASLGSSVGVSKVKTANDLAPALEAAFEYDEKILIEKAINAREIEIAVLEDLESGAPLCSIPGEIIPTHEFYSYEAKYLDEKGADLMIPARLDSFQIKEAQRLGAKVFSALECEGLARVDLFLEKAPENGMPAEFYFNEVNTLPGFTQISMYPKLWEASGVSYKELLSKLIDLALARHARKAKLKRDY